MINKIVFLVLTIFLCNELHAQAPLVQADSALTKLSSLPQNYLQTLTSKSEKYYNAVTSKTEKTLERLAKWEAKIKTILEKTSPETAQRLFGNDQLTFASLLQKYKEGKVVVENYRGQFNEYRDKVNTTLKYLDDKKEQLNSSVVKPLQEAKAKTAKLNEQLKNTEAVQQFIKERKKQLMDQALQYLGKSKYLQKISKESYYYVETLRNYKEIFSDPKKTEELAVKLLNKVPGFSEFIRKNSMLASLFRSAGSPPLGGAGGGSLAGLQTRAQVNNLIQQQIAAGGPNAQQQFQQNIQAAQAQLNELKSKILKSGGSSSDAEIPEGFKPNNQKSKTFWQKWELGMNVQTNRGSSVFPVASDLGLSAGYKPNNKMVVGVGLAGRIGWGKDIRHISLSYSGISARSFAEWKLKGSFHAAAGFEMNYRPEIRSVGPLKDYSSWQQSGLVGISKVVSIKSKFFKKTSIRLLWDFLSYQQVPRAQPVIFRVGYAFK
jgi:hypothetical protein